jgi:hypothetical protein
MAAFRGEGGVGGGFKAIGRSVKRLPRRLAR